MSDRQLKYDVEIPSEHFYKYRRPRDIHSSLFVYRKLFSPNDMNMVTKTLEGAQVGFCAGALMGGYLAVHECDPSFKRWRADLPNLGAAFIKHSTPWLLAGTTFGLATSFAANWRKKEDKFNYAIGGAAGGSVVGLWYKTPVLSFWGAFLGGLVACILKEQQMENPVEYRIKYPRTDQIWLTERIHPEGTDNDEYKYYKP